MKAYRSLPQIAAVCALGAGVAACGSSSTSSTASPTPKASASPTSASASASASASPSASAPTASEQAIKANWEAFFNAKTPVTKRVTLLQDGNTFTTIIRAQAGSALASQATAKVTKVTIVSPDKQADVTYSILVAGKPELTNQKGVAVYRNGTWEVGIASFCGLLSIENGGKTTSLPVLCKSAG